jgi:hypothetical protein
MPSWLARRMDAKETLAPLLIALALTVAASPHTALAQKSSPAIKAEEDSDPAAGEVVIINPTTIKKRQRKTVPNSYKPIKLRPLPPVKKPTQQAAAPSPKAITAKPPSPELMSSKTISRKAASPKAIAGKTEPKPPVGRTSPLAMRTQDAPPPLPKFNKVSLQQRARLRRFPQAPLVKEPAAPVRANNETARLDQEKQRRQATRRLKRQRQVAARRADIQRRRADRDRARNRRFAGRDDEYRQRFRRNRPWRYCRQMAWECRDGDEEACYLWQQRC